MLIARATSGNVFRFASQLAVPPLAASIAYVFAGGDIFATLETAAARWERIAERAWAIILIDVFLSLSSSIAFAYVRLETDISFAMGLLVLFMTTMLIYAEPFAAMDTHVSQISVIPFAILRSMMLAWVNMGRICGFFVLQVALFGLQWLIQVSFKDGTLSGDAAEAGFLSVFAIVLAVLFTAAYADTLQKEREIVS